MNLEAFDWSYATTWPGTGFCRGTYISFDIDLGIFDSAKEDSILMIFPSFRYGIAFEIYGISGSVAGQHIGFFTKDCMTSESGYEIDKVWLIENWDRKFSGILPKLNQTKFALAVE